MEEDGKRIEAAGVAVVLACKSRNLRKRRQRSVGFDETQLVTGSDSVCDIDAMRMIFSPLVLSQQQLNSWS